MRQTVPLEEAQQLLLDLVAPQERVSLDLLQARGLVLAEEITAPYPLPPFDRSPLDGFALRASDTGGASEESPVRLLVTETVRAGHVAKGGVGPGSAIAITTGAPLPPGADCVIRFEDTRREGEHVLIPYPLTAGQNIVRAGEDVAAGELVLSSGQVVTSAAAGVLAELGYSRVMVRRRPRVAVFTTGDELMALGRPLVYGKIYNSNLYTVAAMVEEAGGEVLPLGTVGDDVEQIGRKYDQALSTADLVISTGGASAGERDLAKDAMERAGAKLILWKIDMKPGAFACGLRDGRLLIGLSGSPAAAMTAFFLLVRPLLRRMGGHREFFPPRVGANLVKGFPGRRQRCFVRARVWRQGAEYLARPAGFKSTGMRQALVEGNALIDVPACSGPLRPGDRVEAVLLENEMGGLDENAGADGETQRGPGNCPGAEMQ